MSTDTIMSMMAPASSAAPTSPKPKPGLAATAGQEKSRSDQPFAALIDDKTAPSPSNAKAKDASTDTSTARQAAQDKAPASTDGGHNADDTEAAKKKLPKHDGKDVRITVQAPDMPLSSDEDKQASAKTGDEAPVPPGQPADVKVTATANLHGGDAVPGSQTDAPAGTRQPETAASDKPVETKTASAQAPSNPAGASHGEDARKPAARQREGSASGAADHAAVPADDDARAAAVSHVQANSGKEDKTQDKAAAAQPQPPKGENGLAIAQAAQPASPPSRHAGEKTPETAKADDALRAAAAKQAAKAEAKSAPTEKPAEEMTDADASAEPADAPKQKTTLTGDAQSVPAAQNPAKDGAPDAGTQTAAAETAEGDKGVRKSDKNDARTPVHRQDQKADHTAAAQSGSAADKTDTSKHAGGPASGQTATARTGDPVKLTGESGGVKNAAPAQSSDAAMTGVNAAAQHGAQTKPATESFTQMLNKQAPGPHPASETVAVEIKHRAQAGDNKFIVRLDPPELGRVEVKLTISHDKSVHALLTVDNDKALEALQRDARMLDRSLQDAGLKTDQGSLNFSLKQGHQGQQQMMGQNGGGRHPLGVPGNGALQDGEADLNAAFNTAWSGRISDRPLDLVI